MASHSQADNASVTNNGTIITRGTAVGIGMVVTGVNNNTLINNGLIETVDTGMMLTGGANAALSGTMINNGTIRATNAAAAGVFSYGMWNAMNNSTVTNDGTITATGGEETRGIYTSNTNFNITNTTSTNNGTIVVSGAVNNNYGIHVQSAAGTTHTINNSGSITASGNDSFAIFTQAGNETLNLLSGSKIIGAIDLGAGTDTVKISGRNNSTTLTIENAESITLRVPGIVVGNVVTTVDPTGQSVKGPVLNSLCTGLHGVIRHRLDHFKPEPAKLAATRIEPGMLRTPDQTQAWGKMFRSYRKRDKHGLLFAYDHEYNGFTGGFERTYNKARIGILGGFSRANVEADSESFRTDSNSYFTGAYGQYDFGQVKMAASLIGGYEDHENARMVLDNLSRYKTARADFGSFFLSPSVTLKADYKVAHRLLLRPSATVVYSAGWYDDYQEHGTIRSNLEIDSRTLQALNGSVQLAAVYQIAEWCEFELSAGGTARYTDDGSIDASIGGSDFRFAATNDNSVYAGQVGAYLGADITDKLELYANAQFSRASGDETRDYFMAGLQFNF